MLMSYLGSAETIYLAYTLTMLRLYPDPSSGEGPACCRRGHVPHAAHARRPTPHHGVPASSYFEQMAISLLIVLPLLKSILIGLWICLVCHRVLKTLIL